MARIRTIKPEFWSSAKVGGVSRDSRLLFLGLLNEADDEGRLIGQTKRLAGIIFPFDDDIDGEKVDLMLSELEATGLVQRYKIGGAVYLSIIGFSEHQKIDRRVASRLPAPPEREIPTNSLSSEQSGFSPDKSAESTDKSAEHAEKLVLDLGSRIREKDLGKGEGKDRAPSHAMKVANFVSSEFRSTFEKWRKHSLSKGKHIDDIAEEMQIMELERSAESEQDAIEMLRYTMSRNVVGLITTGEHRDRNQTSQNRSRFNLKDIPV